MKKLIAIIMLIALALSCVACNGGEGNDSSAASDASNTAIGKPVVSDTMSDDSSAVSDDSSAASDDSAVSDDSSAVSDDSSDATDGDNVYINNSNNAIEKDAVAIRPKNLYWVEGKLYAVCFVANGFDKTVETLEVTDLKFEDENGALIAEGSFKPIDNINIAANTCIEWTFIFSGDAVHSENHDLAQLVCDASAKYTLESDESVEENVFLNNSNGLIEKGAVVIRPRYVYWDGDKLIAECFVVNGFDTAASNINLKSLIFEDGDGNVIAGGEFGSIDGLVVGANSYVIWTFTFSGDAVVSSNHALSRLVCKYDVGYYN